MDIVPASKSSDWFKALDNATVNPIGDNNVKDGFNGPKFGLIVDELNKAKTVADQINIWQKYLKDPTILTGKGLDAAKKAFNTWMTGGKLPANVQSVLSKDPLAALPELAQTQLSYNKDDPASVKNYATALKDTYGNLKKADGTPEFTPAYLDSVAAGTIPQDTFDTRINNIAVKAATADLKAQGISLADAGGPEGLASSGKLAEYLNDSTKLASAYTSTPTAGSTVTGGAGNDTVPNKGITALEPYSGSISEVNTPAKMKQVVDNYDPNKGVYHAPSLDTSGKLVANSTSPYSNILNGMLSGYKNPYAADYTNQLKMPETPDLTNIKKSFENNPTSKDLLKLANTAGQPYDPNAQTSLSPALSKIYQPSITNSAGKATKPGAPDTTNTTLPVVTDKPPVVTDKPPVVTDKPPVKTAAELAAEKFAAAKAAYMSSFTAGDYIEPSTRTRADLQTVATTDPKMAAQLDWSATQDATRAQNVKPIVTPLVTKPEFTVTPQTSYSSADYSPELKAALATRAITDTQNATVGDTITANDNLARGIVTPNINTNVSTGNMNTYATGPNGESGIPSALTTAPQFTSGDYIPPANRTMSTVANNPALANQVAWSATQDAAQAKQAAPAVGINTLPNNTGATGTTSPAPFTVNSTTSYSPNDYSPELKAALAARAASMSQ